MDAQELRQADRDRHRIGETVAETVSAWLQSAESRAWRPRSRARSGRTSTSASSRGWAR
jgi:hypothetical protein